MEKKFTRKNFMRESVSKSIGEAPETVFAFGVHLRPTSNRSQFSSLDNIEKSFDQRFYFFTDELLAAEI